MPAALVDAALAARGIDAERLAEAVGERANWVAGDAAYLSGSIAEGMANSRSDLDVFIVTDRETSVATSGMVSVLDVEGVAVDLEVWPRHRVQGLLDRLCALPADVDRDSRAALTIASDELAFLHRLLIGVALLGHEEVRELQARVDRMTLSRVLFDRAAAIIPGQAADLAGLLDAADVDSAAVSAQRLLGSALDAVLAVDGNTNPSEKWRLRRLRDHLDRGLTVTLPKVLRTFGSYAAARDLYLLRAWPGDDHPDSLVEYVHECARLGRHVVPWGQRELLGLTGPAPDRREDGGNSEVFGDSQATGQLLPRLTPDVMLCWRGQRLVLFSAGGNIEMEIGPVTAEALEYFDGRTPPGVAARQLVAGRRIDTSAMVQALEDLRTVLAAHGLVELVPCAVDRAS